MPTIENDVIIFNSNECFDAEKTLKCGQIFRFSETEDGFEVFSGSRHAVITATKTHTYINSNDTAFFWKFFDCDTDYDKVLGELSDLPLMKSAIEFGYGIRVLKQDKFETLISFIISANNNIPRIRKAVFALCENGTNFPSPADLAQKSVEYFRGIGLGYRAEYVKHTATRIADGFDLESLDSLPTDGLLTELKSLKGVGPKVADCVALFAYSRSDVFPVDTWVKKIATDIFGRTDSAADIRKNLVALYGQNAGIAQQYLFFHKRATEGNFGV